MPHGVADLPVGEDGMPIGLEWDADTGHYREKGTWWSKFRCEMYRAKEVHPAYLYEPWNRLDFFLVVISLLGAYLGEDSDLKVLRVFRAFRPLRVLGKDKDLQKILRALMMALPAVVNVIFMAICLYFVLGIMGVSLMMGLFYRCNDGIIANMASCSGEWANDLGVWSPRTWSQPRSNFDNTMNAMLTLFKMATLNNWSVVMHDGMSVTQVDVQPERFAAPIMAVYFLFFIIIGSLFFLQLIVSVIIDNFSKEMHRDRSEEELRLRDLQHLMSIMWGKRTHVQARPSSGITQLCYDICVDCYPRKDCQIELKPYLKGGWASRASGDGTDVSGKRMKKAKEEGCVTGCCGGDGRGKNVLQQRGLHIVHSNFEMLILFCIVINSSLTLTEHHGQNKAWSNFLYQQNAFFVVVFTLEATVKILGLSPSFYFCDPWNAFDFLVVLGSWPTLVMDSQSTSFLRLIRILRLSRIVKRFDSLRAIVETFVNSAKQIGQVLAIVFLLVFCYAVLGCQLYGKTKRGASMSSVANFESFPGAVFLMFRVIT
jgi:hypothetical protein